MTGLTVDTDRPVLWLWMVVYRPGHRAVVRRLHGDRPEQRRSALRRLATASLTFFQQIGGTIGLTLASTFLAAALTADPAAPRRQRRSAAGDRPVRAGSGGGQLDLTGTGDLGARILAATPEQFRPFIEPLIPQIVQAIHESFSLAIASSFWIGIVAALRRRACSSCSCRRTPARAAAMAAPESASTGPAAAQADTGRGAGRTGTPGGESRDHRPVVASGQPRDHDAARMSTEAVPETLAPAPGAATPLGDVGAPDDRRAAVPRHAGISAPRKPALSLVGGTGRGAGWMGIVDLPRPCRRRGSAGLRPGHQRVPGTAAGATSRRRRDLLNARHRAVRAPSVCRRGLQFIPARRSIRCPSATS